MYVQYLCCRRALAASEVPISRCKAAALQALQGWSAPCLAPETWRWGESGIPSVPFCGHRPALPTRRDCKTCADAAVKARFMC